MCFIYFSLMNFELRPFRPGDAESLGFHANNRNISDNLTNGFPFPYTIDHADKFIEMARSHEPTQIMAITHDDKVIGGIGLHRQEDVYAKNMELGYWLSELHWGKGIMTEAIKQMITYGFENFDISRIFARPFGYNKGSIKALDKAGFVQEAFLKETFYKNGQFFDEFIFAVRTG